MSGPYDISTYDDTVTNSSGTFVKNVILIQANADHTRFVGKRQHMRAAHTRFNHAGELATSSVFAADGDTIALDRLCGDTAVSSTLGNPFFQAPRYTGGVAASPTDINGRRRNFEQLWVRVDDDIQSGNPLQLDIDVVADAVEDYRFGTGDAWGLLLNPTTLNGDIFKANPTLNAGVAPIFNSFIGGRSADPIRGPAGHRVGRIDSLADVWWLFNDRTRTLWRTRTGWASSFYGLPSAVELYFNSYTFYYYENPAPVEEVDLYLEEEVVVKTGDSWDYSYPSTHLGKFTVTVAHDWYWAGSNRVTSWNWMRTVTSVGTLTANSVGYRYKLVASGGGGGETVYSHNNLGGAKCGVWHKIPPSNDFLWSYPGGDGELAGIGAGLIVDIDAH